MSISILKQFAQVALAALRPEAMISDAVALRGSQLTIAGQRYDLRKHQRVYVVGAGKATLAMAKQLNAILGKHITAGYINVPATGQQRVGKIIVQHTAHPFPNRATVIASKRILQCVQAAAPDDLIICLISGGGSSMLTLPRAGVTLQLKKNLTKKLMHRGANITALNTVRKHL
ncbi:MAG: DUF4147 domain-containing protein, partial [Candidatus Kerfeldbacteria bacterium]|nr:DUF4147 domain-containing protein [Candidatus Kerfeldbacteria bacterium]